MKLLIVRHAVAADREEFAATGKDDDLRPLTPDGKRKMRKVAKGLVRELRPDLIATSPLTRAAQTAAILAAAYAMEVGAVVDALRPDSPFDRFARWAGQHGDAPVIAVVGHEPHLSGLVSWLMAGGLRPTITLKKGGACLVVFDGPPRKGFGTLAWLATPSQLAARRG